MRRALQDTDDEVRDRAALQLLVLEGKAPAALPAGRGIGLPGHNLEEALRQYLAAGSTDRAFDIKAVPTATVLPLTAKEKRREASLAAAAAAVAPKEAPVAIDYGQVLSRFPDLAPLGKPLLSSESPAGLTEEGTEYQISVVKHVFPAHLVLQFNCRNTVREQVGSYPRPCPLSWRVGSSFFFPPSSAELEVGGLLPWLSAASRALPAPLFCISNHSSSRTLP